jgi:hypothetical protein
MRKTAKKTPRTWQPEVEGEDENDITQPMRVICSQAGAPRSSRVYWLKKIGESARHPDWTEIGSQDRKS